MLAALWAMPGSAQEAASEQGTASLQAGIAAYRAGDVRLARQHFLQAAQLGDDSAELRFNLALSGYKLGDDSAAQAGFESLLEHPTLAAAAEYHLGLIAARSGRSEQAAAHWRAAQRHSESPAVQQLAELALQRLAGDAPVPARLAISASFAAGFDGNRTQTSDRAVDQPILPGLEAAAEFAEGFAAATYRPDLLAGAELRGGLYSRDYIGDDALDQRSLLLGLQRSLRVSDWQYGAALESETVWLDDARFQRALSLNVDAARSLGIAGLSLRYRPSWITGGRDYDYVDGWSQRLEAAYGLTRSRSRLRLQYEAEINDRRDLELGDEFFSQSPLRQGLAARLTQRLSPLLSVEGSVRYRYSWFRDRNRSVDDADPAGRRRVDRLAQAGLTAVLTLAQNAGLRLDYRYTEHDSRIQRYDYDRHEVLLGLDWLY